MNMTAIQICALIGLIIGAALLYWTGYRGGLADGRIEGVEEGTNNQRAESAKTIRELEASLQLIRADHQRLNQHCKNHKDSKALGEEHHQILLDIAEQLRIAAETFSGFRTGKKLKRDTRTLRDQALVMEERLCVNAAALIPHAKLREADPPDATLIAQDRPLAQPVVGYTQVQAVDIAKEAA